MGLYPETRVPDLAMQLSFRSLDEKESHVYIEKGSYLGGGHSGAGGSCGQDAGGVGGASEQEAGDASGQEAGGVGGADGQ